MIETGLVYIYSILPARAFKGCGALLDGGYVATCRHVWRVAAPAGQPPSDEPAEVEIEFPFGTKEKAGDGDKYVVPTRRARLADACEVVDGTAPDLIFLALVEPRSQPSGVMWLQPAAHERFETGAGFAHAGLIGRDTVNPNRVSDVRVRAEIADFINSEGRRQFTGGNSASYWTTRGASGSPVFLESGQQLAGIMSLSETGGNEGETHLHEAFVVPATTIRKYLTARLAADEQAEKRGIDPANLQPILAKLGVLGVPDDKIAERLDASVEEILAQAAKPVPASNDGADIDAAIVASRAKLRDLDTAGALDVLQAKIAGEEQERARRRVPLLKERAAVERLAFDYEAAKQTLAEVTRLAPDDVWAFIGLGDLYRITGPLDDAAKAFRTAEAAARRQGDERDLSVALNKIGAVQVEQGDLSAALKSYQDGLAIADKLAKADPGHTGWQRDLSVSYNKIGDVQVAQGDLAGALKSFQDSHAIRDKLAKADPGHTGWQRDLAATFSNLASVHWQSGDSAKARDLLRQGQSIMARMTKLSPDNTHWAQLLAWFDRQIAELAER